MKLDTKLRTLGPVNHAALKAAVSNLPREAWLDDKLRQESFSAHAQTQSIILLFTTGWPEIVIEQRKGWDLFSQAAIPLMRQIIGEHYSVHGTVIRAVIAKLVAGGVIDEHFDDHPTFSISHRIHVPLFTNDKVDFVIDGETFNLKEGIAYEVNNLEYHFVNNRSAEDRVHFIFDYVVDAPAS
jgi:hypothetical protein